MKILVALSLLSLCAGAQAQTAEPGVAGKDVRHIVRMVPQEFFVNTLRVDWEFRTGDRSSVQLSPSFTSAEQSNQFSKIIGGGLELQKKFYLRKEEVQLKGFYGGITASYHRFRLNEDHYYFDYYNGISYYDPREENVNRIAANLVLGYQFIIKEVVAIDVYAGGGIRVGNSDRDDKINYSYDILDPRYNGIAPKVGFSVGVVL